MDLRAASCCTWASAKFWSKFWTWRKGQQKGQADKPQKRSFKKKESESEGASCSTVQLIPFNIVQCLVFQSCVFLASFLEIWQHLSSLASEVMKPWSYEQIRNVDEVSLASFLPGWSQPDTNDLMTCQWPTTASLRCSVNCHLNSACMLYFTSPSIL